MQVRRISIQAVQRIVWTAQNLSCYHDLHVADRGSRIATVTDVAWLGEDYLVAAHHASRRIALFDLASPQAPILSVELPYRIDGLAVQPPKGNLIEIVASATWKAHYAVIHLTRDVDKGEAMLQFRGSCMQPLRQPPSFSHGVFYMGDLVGVCYNAGEDPRIDVDHGRLIVRLPVDWFPTSACWSSSNKMLYIVANGHQPQPSAFEGAKASIWQFSLDQNSLVQLAELQGAHFDSCIFDGEYLWMNDQYGDRVLGMDIQDAGSLVALESPEISFPHGISLSLGGRLAVSNYKTSSIAIFDLPSPGYCAALRLIFPQIAESIQNNGPAI